jgi:TetR/AcrR family transcriptional regulator
VLELSYAEERRLQDDARIRAMEPEVGMRRLVALTATIWAERPETVRLLLSENFHKGRHVRSSESIVAMYNPLLETIRELLRRGVKKGVFRDGLDPIDLYISMTVLLAHYIANIYTFEAIFHTKLTSRRRWQQRLRHTTDMVMCYVRRDGRS